MAVKPPVPKHKMDDLGDKLIISMPSRKILPFILVFGVWSLIWFGVEIGLVSTILSLGEFDFVGVIFFVIWVVAWNVLGVFLIYNLLWQLIGKEEIQITNQSITISQVVFGYRRSKEYLAEHIKDLDIARVSMLDLNFRRGAIPTGLNFGMISFDYGARTFKFAGSVEEAESKQILAEIQQKYPQYKN